MAMLVIGLVLAALAAAPPATAAVPGLELVVRGSGPSSVNKSAVAACPEGKRLLGVGGHVRRGANRVLIDRVESTLGFDTRQATVHASEFGGVTPTAWSVRALAICADEPLGGVATQRTNPPVPDSQSRKSASTENGPCQGGDRLTGAGGAILGAEGEVVLDRVIPRLELGSALARGVESPPTPADWQVRASHLCSPALPGQELVVKRGRSDSRNKHATARCPAGKRVVGTGGEIVGNDGQVGITYLRPDPDLRRVHVRGAEFGQGTAGNWAVRAYAICATR
jgi:hypothetical protein